MRSVKDSRYAPTVYNHFSSSFHLVGIFYRHPPEEKTCQDLDIICTVLRYYKTPYNFYQQMLCIFPNALVEYLDPGNILKI